jgi:hypothetical protein
MRMRSRRGAPEVVGMAFLDLICCAFGGVILLYILADRNNGSAAPVENGMSVVIAELKGGVTHDLGMQLSGAGGWKEACWRNGDPCKAATSLWDRRPGTLIGMVRADKPVMCVTVAMTGPSPRLVLPNEVEVRVSSSDNRFDRTVKLLRRYGYRTKLGTC